MSIVTYKSLKLYTDQVNILQPIVVKEDDERSRFLDVTLMAGEEKVIVADTDEVWISVKRSDGNANAFGGTVNDDGSVRVPIPNWLMAVSGKSACCVSALRGLGYALTPDTEVIEGKSYYTKAGDVYTKVENPSGNPHDLGYYEYETIKLSSNTFYIEVQPAEYGGDDIADDPYFSILVDLIGQVEEIKVAWAAAIDTGLNNPTSDSKTLSEKAIIDNFVQKAVLDDYARIDGNYATLGAGHADSAASLDTEVGVDDETPFAYQTAGGESDITTGMQQLKKLVGCKIVKNNYMTEQTEDTLTLNGITVNIYANKFKVNAGTSGSSPAAQTFKIIDVIAGHIYFSIGCFLQLYVNNSWDSNLNNNTPSAWGPAFYTLSKSGKVYCEVYIRSNEEYTTKEYVFNPFIDLTQMFGNNDIVNAIIGSGTNAEKYANLLSFLGGWLPEDYDAGSFTSCKSAKLKMVDYNLWDEQWELGSIDQYGNLIDSSTSIRCKNIIPCMGGKEYYITDPSAYVVITFYDENNNKIDYTGYGQYQNCYNGGSHTFTAPINAVYMRFRCSATYGTIYKNDICIFLYWDGSRIGYELFAEHIYDLPNIDLNGILTLVDGKVVADGDELYPNGEGNAKHYKTLDMGDLYWTKYTDSGKSFFESSEISDIKSGSWNTVIKVISEKYIRKTLTSGWATMDNMSFGQNGKRLRVKNNTYDTADAFKIAMTGTHFLYELDEPDGLEASAFAENIYVDDFGTMQFLDENDNQIVGLQGNEVFYKANIAGFAESLYVKTDGDVDNIALKSDIPHLYRHSIYIEATGVRLATTIISTRSTAYTLTDFLNDLKSKYTILAVNGGVYSGDVLYTINIIYTYLSNENYVYNVQGIGTNGNYLSNFFITADMITSFGDVCSSCEA